MDKVKSTRRGRQASTATKHTPIRSCRRLPGFEADQVDAAVYQVSHGKVDIGHPSRAPLGI